MDKKWILVIEDEEELLSSMCEILNKKGFSAIPAHSYKEALQKVKKQKFHCIVTDLRLAAQDYSEKESGVELVEYIRSQPKEENYKTPIFVVSGNLDDDAIQHLKGKIQGALVKPFSVDEFIEKMKMITK